MNTATIRNVITSLGTWLTRVLPASKASAKTKRARNLSHSARGRAAGKGTTKRTPRRKTK